ncbi:MULTISPECIES: molecular chaperone HscC [Bacillus]|uniref:Chaperone protein DnaK n=1 Tax=Bacillus anthracis TaxID=1392 RepID=A0A2A7DCP5_BACAN|nr:MULTISPECIES: molecular chaperone HscC [Bacillus]MCP1164319.1 molecular chaperone HscC [Bacillus sp. 1813sda1]MDC7972293.1 molecular chaperone HscC [Bacillus sp. BLCC-B18]OTW73320.1 molecular chaperone HscC [Bacillus thuringiensis serovar coreanensis]OTX56737.1 molecular chaperone HscC [Bacillus thuringiensis serovar guiyangiensis]OTX71147.1 molecular chaperone HscC [Bacillus thuringiensis serovar roskildiensis]
MAIIGIDLGTTNSLVATWSEDGAKLIPNVLGEFLTPSVVSIDETGEILVGRIAKERLITHPQLTAATFKRFIGTEKKYELGTYTFSSEELSSFIIKSLKQDAEAYLNEEVTGTVISVPAYFNDTQRKSTKRAVEIAGLTVERLISEPTAAAIAYGLYQEQSETKFLVFDLGGGTFDVSILELFEGIMDVKSIAGDNYLGGEDFTKSLMTFFLESHQLNPDSLDSKTLSLIYTQAERCKLALCNESTATMNVVIHNQTYETSINRGEFEKIVTPLLLRLRYPIERALRDASLNPNDLDAVILIGGATRMPLVKSVISKMFGRMPYANINPDETVALGAAIQVALKERNKALEEVILTDVCPYSLGTSVVQEFGDGKSESGYFFPIIERNTPIPVSKVERLYTVKDRQQFITIDVYQGENRRVVNNLKLGELKIKIPPAPAGNESVDIRYTYDINGILEVEVISTSTGEKKRTIIQQNAGNLTDEEIEKRLLELRDIKIHPRDREENRLLLAKCERLYEELLGDERKKISILLQQFERVLTTQNDKKIKEASSKLKEHIESMERWANR